jgi:hypothetical protein
MLLIDTHIFCKNLLFVQLLGQLLSSSDETGMEIGAINSVHFFTCSGFLFLGDENKCVHVCFFNLFFRGIVTYSQLTRHQEV